MLAKTTFVTSVNDMTMDVSENRTKQNKCLLIQVDIT